MRGRPGPRGSGAGALADFRRASIGLLTLRSRKRIEPGDFIHDLLQRISLTPEHDVRGGRIENPKHIDGGDAANNVGGPNDAVDMNAVGASGKPLVNLLVKVLEVVAHREWS